MTAKPPKKAPPTHKVLTFRSPEILEVGIAARFLTMSADTVNRLFQKGEFPGRKVGRKWITTKSAMLCWLESSATSERYAGTRRQRGAERSHH